jgi:hypothetical protein
MLRVWLRGKSLRSIGRLAAVDRKTARRCVAASLCRRLVASSTPAVKTRSPTS